MSARTPALGISWLRLALLCQAFLFILPAAAEVAIPPALREWQPWVLHRQEEALCPTDCDQGQVRRCIWPSRLSLQVSARQGRFEGVWLLRAPGWAVLPGAADSTWPAAVVREAKPVPVIARQGLPSVYLPAGEHRLSGEFGWPRMPETLMIGPATGLVELSLEGKAVAVPLRDAQGRLWLQRRSEAAGEQQRLEVRVFRLLTDEIPALLTTQLRLEVAGTAREARLANLLPVGATPMRLTSALPVRLSADGALLVQLRPGRWQVELEARLEGELLHLGPLATPFGQEIWSYAARHPLRLAQVEGAPAVEPRQTDMPEPWRVHPAFIINNGAELRFKQTRRGDPDPAPDNLSLQRNLWLDFDGGGFTVQDRIGGTMSRQWYLALNPPGDLGRVTVDGEQRLITAQGSQRKPGVELRQGKLSLEADSRLPGGGSLPAVGWDHDFRQVSAQLNLPPGWRLLAASGADSVSDTWASRWSLLEVFIVLVTALAAARVRQVWVGAAALVTLLLIGGEPGAPRLVFLSLLAALGLLKVMPPGRLRRLVTLWAGISLLTLLGIALPFMLQQVRWGLYPQLEPVSLPLERGRVAMQAGAPLPEESDSAEMTAPAMRKSKQDLPRPEAALPAPVAPAAPQAKSYLGSEVVKYRTALQERDPDALVQTGPGLPNWRWRTHRLNWSGPVQREQQLRLLLLPPAANLALALLRVLLLVALIMSLIDWRRWRELVPRPALPANAAAALLLAALTLGLPAAACAEGAFPPQALLDELRQRLLQPPECLPACADLASLELNLTAERLQVLLTVQAAVETAVPLPASLESWMPSSVELDDKAALAVLQTSEDVLRALVPAGVHRLTLSGQAPRGDRLQLALPLRPRRAVVKAEGWDVQGLASDGSIAASLQLTRRQPSATEPGESDTVASLPPFLWIERTLHLGLNWGITTRVQRQTPTGTPVALRVPLLAGEAVTSAGFAVENGFVQVNLAPDKQGLTWESTLAIEPRIVLTAPREVAWVERWVLDASPLWHCEAEGIAAIQQLDAGGQWRPEWRPWPGESLSLDISRPEAIPGRHLTIDRARLEWTPGERFSRGLLQLAMRSSRGGQHSLTLPEGAELQSVTIDGRERPIRQSGRELPLPLVPGRQEIRLEWHQPDRLPLRLKTPEFNLGAPAVNAEVALHLPAERWVPWSAGPRLGPAVLFWSVLVVAVLAAVALGRTRLAPLGTGAWLLLTMGLTQVQPLAAMLVVGWLLAFGWRRIHPPGGPGWLRFDLVQILLAILTGVALVCLYHAVERGLLGLPDMQIAGNGSSARLLQWTQDRIEGLMPQPWALALPMWSYRVLMLPWALWLAWSLIGWLRWCWEGFGQGGLWRKPVWPRLRRRGRVASENPGEAPVA